MLSILLIEGEAEVKDQLEMQISNAGYGVYSVENDTDIAEQVFSFGPDVVLLDLDLPEINCYELFIDIKKKISIPVIFSSKFDTSMDEQKALAIGGEGFVVKPYDIESLVELITAIFRKSFRLQENIMNWEGLQLDVLKNKLTYGERSMELTKSESKILYCLYKNLGDFSFAADIIDFLEWNQILIDKGTLRDTINKLQEKIRLFLKIDQAIRINEIGYAIFPRGRIFLD